LRARLDPAPATDDVVELGGVRAYRYRDLRPEGSQRRLTIFVVPTDAGVATAVCVVARRSCEAIVATAELSGVEAFALPPRDDFAVALRTTMHALNVSRRRERAQLGEAGTAKGQAREATDLSVVYADAARDFGRLPSGPAEKAAADKVAAGAADLERAYRRLAAAARAERAARYRDARAAIHTLERHLARRIERFGALGYKVG
jgi:hypothetical protein